MRTICTGSFRGNHTNLPTCTVAWGQGRNSVGQYESSASQVQGVHAEKLQTLLGQDVLVAWDGDIGNLFAWLQPRDFDFLSSSAGAAVLEAWIARLDPPKPSLPPTLSPDEFGISCVSGQ